MKNTKNNVIIILSFIMILAMIIQVVRSGFSDLVQRSTSVTDSGSIQKREDFFPKSIMNRKERDNYLIIYNSKEMTSLNIKNNILKTIGPMKKDYSLYDINGKNTLNVKGKTVIVCIQDLDEIENIKTLSDFVYNGGSLFFTITLTQDDNFYGIYRKLGINDTGDYATTNGIKLTSNILIKNKGVTIGKNFITNSCLAVNLDDRCKVYATSLDHHIPLLWDRHYGKGKFMVFNGTMFDTKSNRGMIAGALSLLPEDYIYPIMNQKVFFIDDFPSPFPDGTKDWIQRDYGRSIKNFFRDIWWPDIMRLGALYNTKYTGMVICSYDNNTGVPSVSVSKYDKSNLLIYGRELLRNGGELGVHGYNHQSLVLKGEPEAKYVSSDLGYKLWKSKGAVKASITRLLDIFKSVYPKYKMTSYVPPSNVLSSKGKAALEKAFPGLETLCSIYYQGDGTSAYVQEFETDKDGVTEFPRLTYGYMDDSENNWSIMNGVNALGVVSHFIHPDDVLDPERNRNSSWQTLGDHFESFVKRIYKKYPWLRSNTITPAGRSVKNYLKSKTNITYGKKQIEGYINGFKGDYYFILRTNKSVLSKTGCTIKSIDKNVYLVCAQKPHFTIRTAVNK